MTENIFFDRSRLKHCGKNVLIGKTVRIRAPERVSIGDNVVIDDFTYISGEVTIGDYTHICASCTLSASKSRIEIGAFSAVSSGSRVYAATSGYVEAGLDNPLVPEEFAYGSQFDPVILERFTLVGANSVVLPGVHLPEGLASAAGLVLRKSMSFAPWTVVVDAFGTSIQRRGKEQVYAQVNKFYKLDE